MIPHHTLNNRFCLFGKKFYLKQDLKKYECRKTCSLKFQIITYDMGNRKHVGTAYADFA
jgi:hypothetical protein